jgi:hypothetical protein
VRGEQLLTFSCSNNRCNARLRIGRRLDKPVLAIGALKYCALCGSPGMAMHDVDENIWELLAEKYEMKPHGVELLYNMWPRHEYSKFADFVDHVKSKLKKEAVSV